MEHFETEVNLFEECPAAADREVVQTLVEAPGTRIERIVSHGQRSQAGFWYDQETDEFVALVSGAARLEFDGRPEPLVMRAGDTVVIPAGVRHRVAWTDPERDTVWLAVHYRRSGAPGGGR